MLAATRTCIAIRQANKLLVLSRQPLIIPRTPLTGPRIRQTSCLSVTRTRHYLRFSSMADCGGESSAAPMVAGGGEGEQIVKSAKQLKKDAKKKEKLEKFQQKQAKMAGQQKQNNNSGAEAREV